MTFNKIKSHAKINLALNITGKNSSLHKIESIIAFVSLHDEIWIKLIKSNKQETIKLIIGSIILLDLFFSLTHNNKIFSAIIWIYLSFLFNKNNKLINEN